MSKPHLELTSQIRGNARTEPEKLTQKLSPPLSSPPSSSSSPPAFNAHPSHPPQLSAITTSLTSPSLPNPLSYRTRSPSLLTRLAMLASPPRPPPETLIFERSVQEFDPDDHPSLPRRRNEDQIAPTLDASTKILNDLSTDLDSIELIYPCRRNSSVLGLSMTLGARPPLFLRRGSSFSALPQSPPVHLQMSPDSPLLPARTPSLHLSFYSYADMINNDEYARRPAIRSSSSFSNASDHGALHSPAKSLPPFPPQAFEPRRKIRSRVNSIRATLSPECSSLDALVLPNSAGHLSSNFSHPLSPDLLDNEDGFHRVRSNASSFGGMKFEPSPSRRNSIASSVLARNVVPPTTLCSDEDSFVSTSIGDCIRQSTLEIGGYHK